MLNLNIMEEELNLGELQSLSTLGKLKALIRKRADRLMSIWQSWSTGRRWLTGGLFVVLLLIFLGWAGTRRWGSSNEEVGYQPHPTIPLPTINPEEPKDQVSLLDGVLISRSARDEIGNRKVLAVIIENHVVSRPQSGVNEAELVYEALAEGGITRLTAFYWRNTPQIVGPIRSLRKYFLDWISELDDPPFLHDGYAASDNPDADALGYLKRYAMKSLPVYWTRRITWRDSSRIAPHNEYASTLEAWQEAEKAGIVNPNFSSWKFKEDEDPKIYEQLKQSIQINWGGWGENDYSVVWHYEPTKNVYLREHLVSGKMVDRVTGQQIQAKNIAIMYARVALANDGSARIVYQTLGENRAQIIYDGTVIEGSWRKDDRLLRTRFYDGQGQEIEWNRGPIWIEVVPEESIITIT